jgi:hypothetical protein
MAMPDVKEDGLEMGNVHNCDPDFDKQYSLLLYDPIRILPDWSSIAGLVWTNPPGTSNFHNFVPELVRQYNELSADPNTIFPSSFIAGLAEILSRPAITPPTLPPVLNFHCKTLLSTLTQYR